MANTYSHGFLIYKMSDTFSRSANGEQYGFCHADHGVGVELRKQGEADALILQNGRFSTDGVPHTYSVLKPGSRQPIQMIFRRLARTYTSEQVEKLVKAWTVRAIID